MSRQICLHTPSALNAGAKRSDVPYGGTGLPLSMEELVSASTQEFKSVTGKLTKDWLLCLLRESVSQLKQAKFNPPIFH